MKNYFKKIKQMSFLMTIVMLLTSVVPMQSMMSVYGATTTKDSLGSYDTNDDGTNVGVDFTQGFETQYSESLEIESLQNADVYVSQASTFSVTIPKTIILSGEDKNAIYVIGVKGNISATDKIFVKPEESFLMKQIGKDDITALVTQDKEEFAYSDGVRENVPIYSNGTIVANDMSAGSWNGSFIFNISLNEEPEIIVVANDQNGIDLNAKATYILGNDKDTLVKELISSGLITNENEVSKLINVNTDSFENEAIATIYVKNFANIGDKIAIYHYDETTNSWEYIAICVVNENYQISANFTSFSPIALVKVSSNHSHIYNEWVTTIEPTCETNGIKERKCNLCDYTEEENLNALNHDYNDEYTIDKEPTCTEKGSKSQHCSRCNAKQNITDIEILGHDIIGGECSRCEYSIAGLYDENDVLLCSWEDSGINIECDYNSAAYRTSTTSPYYIIENKYPTTKKIIIPNDITSIGQYAFYNCSNLTNVIIGKNINSIGMYAFSRCSGLTKLLIPSNINTIDKYAFSYCSGLTNLNIENGVQSIGDMAFYDCDGLANVTLPNSITNVGYQVFQDCNGLTDVTISNGITIISDSLFDNCTNLTNVNIPNSVTKIGNSAFSDCKSLTSIKIPSNVKTIGVGSFDNCTNLTNVIIEEGVTSIEKNAFSYCTRITNITIPNSVTSINKEAFKAVPHITYNGNLTGAPWGAKCVNGYIENNFVYTDNTKTNLAAFIENESHAIVPNSVTTIGKDAFAFCRNKLTNVTIPDSVTELGENAFYCSGLTDITIPDSVTSIGSYAFYSNNQLINIILSNNIKGINSCTFDRCSKLTNVIIPNGVTYINDSAFYGCGELTSIIIPNGVTSIGPSVFRGCGKLTNVEIPNTVKSIGSNAFYNCNGLTNVTIPNSVTSIGSNAFYNVPCITYSPQGKATGSPWGALTRKYY